MNYSDFADGTITLVPETSSNSIHLVFDNFDINSSGDTLFIFDGNNLSTPMIGSYTQLPEHIYSTHETGALTLRFISDQTMNGQGFSATISCISDTSLPDLEISHAVISETSIYPGSNIGVWSEFSNSGDLIARNITSGCYLSADSILDSTDILLNTGLIDYLEPGADDSLIFWSNLPLGTNPGQQYIIVKADNDELIPEKNEDNNIFIVPIEVQNSIVDLYIDNAHIHDEYEIAPGGSIRFWTRIGNSGQQRIDTFNTAYYISADTVFDASDTYLGHNKSYYLYPGNTTYLSVTKSIPDSQSTGTFYLIIFADHQNVLTETDETNNSIVLPFEIVPKRADIYISSLSLTSGFLYKNINNELACLLRNNGNYIIEDVYTDCYLSKDEILDSSDMVVCSDHLQNLSYDYTSYRYINLQFDDPDSIENGLYFLIVKTDSPDLVVEENENNNIYLAPVLVADYITDFEICSLSVNSTTISPNSRTIVNCGYLNNSAMRVNRFNTDFYLSKDTVLHIPDDSIPNPDDDTYFGYQMIYSINPNSTYSRSSDLYLNDSIAYGDYYLIAIADPDNTLNEADTTDNLEFIPVYVNESKDDVEITQIELPLDILKAGQTIYGNVRIKNNGNQFIDYVPFGCYLSVDTVLDVNDNLLRTEYAYNLYPGDSSVVPCRISIPYNQVEGYYFILMIADNYDYIIESNENNNTKYVAITIDNTIYSNPPELSLNNCSLDQSGIAAGDNVYFNGTAMNTGNDVSNIRIAYYLSTDSALNTEDLNHRIHETYFYSMYQGYVQSFSHSFILPQSYDTGNYYLIAKIDDYNAVFEDDEQNNIAVLPVQIKPPTIDLLIYNIGLNTNILLKGGSEGLSITIRNNGSSASPSCRIAYFLSADETPVNEGMLIGTKDIPSVNPGSSRYVSDNIQIPDTIQEGVYYLKIKVDYQETVIESDEENNALIYIVGVLNSDVDFRTDQVEMGSSAIIPGNSANIRYTFYNDGITKSPETMLGYYLSTDTLFDPESDELITYEIISSLASNSSRYISDYIQIPGNLDTGQYRLFLVSDYQEIITERSEENNVSFIDFNILPPFVDLVVENFTTDKNNVAHGEEVYISCIIRNLGNFIANSSNVGYFLSADSIPDAGDVLLGEDYVYSLNSNDYSYESHYFTISDTSYTGDYFILVQADYNEQNQESDEANNLAFKMITLREADVDIVITDISVDNNNLFSGTSTYINYTISNNGTTGCPQSEIRFYLSQDTILNPFEDSYIAKYNNSSISAGYSRSASAYVNTPQTIITGTYYLFAVADMLDAIKESDESNNQDMILINLTESFVDLVITNATIPDNIYNPGDYTMVSFYLRNTGNQQSNSGYVYFYLSNDTVYGGEDILITSSYYSYVSGSNYRYYDVGIYIPYEPINNECYMLIYADRSNNTNEKNENNNIQALPVTINTTGFTDLRSEWNYHDKYEYNYGDSLKATFYFPMSWTDTISQFYSGFYLSSDKYHDPDDYFITEIINTAPFTDTLIINEIQFQMPNDIDPGIYYVLGFIDSRNEVYETDEDNNIGWFRIELVNNTDLRSGSDTHEKHSFETGDTITCTFYFPYLGRDSISPFYTGFYLSSDEHPDPNDILLQWFENLGPFTDNIISVNVNLSVPDTIESGVYYILGIIDIWNNIPELDEYNNIHSFEIEWIRNLVDLNEVMTGSTMFYPNPATDHICISNEEGYRYMKILNSSGMLVMNLNIQYDQNIIDISGLMPGNYTIILVGDEETEMLKLVKIREQ